MEPASSQGADARATDATTTPLATVGADDSNGVKSSDGDGPTAAPADARAGIEHAANAAEVDEITAVIPPQAEGADDGQAVGRPDDDETTAPVAANETTAPVAAKETTAGRLSQPKEAEVNEKLAAGSLGLCVVQWNQKDLSYESTQGERTPSESKERSEKRIQNISIELIDTNRYSKAGPAVVVMQEIVGRKGGGGERALIEITKGMNKLLKFGKHDTPFHYELSGVVNPMSARAEQYAVVYNELLVGQCEVDSSFLLSLSQFDPVGQNNEGTVRIGGATIDLGRAREVFRDIVRNQGKLGDRFDRLPALFSFPGPQNSRFPKKLHIIAAHSSTGGANKSPHQNMAESIFLQEICHQAAAQGEYVILVGDFNHDEPENRTHFMWDVDGELYDVSDKKRNTSGVNEKQLFEPSRTAFLNHYVRACNSLLPTNVYPFLAGGDAMGKHNEDIWLPKVPGQLAYVGDNEKKAKKLNDELFHTTNGGVLFEIFDMGRKRLGRVMAVPPRILKQWDNAARKFYQGREFEGGYQPRLNAGARQALNMMLAKVWSDHRPLAVTLKLTDRKQTTPAKKRAGPGDEAIARDETMARNETLARNETMARDEAMARNEDVAQDLAQGLSKLSVNS